MMSERKMIMFEFQVKHTRQLLCTTPTVDDIFYENKKKNIYTAH